MATPVPIAKPGTSIGSALAYPAYHSSPSNGTNAIINGDFETDDFTGWTVVNHPLVADSDDWISKYEGLCSGLNNHYYDYFFQPLSYSISNVSRFQGAMLAIVSIDDSDWHETVLTITAPGQPILYLHYRLQSSQPTDTAADKYFLIGTQLSHWYSWNRNLTNDLVMKGASQYLSGKVIDITCQQGGICCTAYDVLGLAESLWNPTNGSLAIWVVDSVTNAPVAGVVVVSSFEPFGQPALSNVTDSWGAVYFNNILTGFYQFECSKDGYYSQVHPFTIYSGSQFWYGFIIEKVPSPDTGPIAFPVDPVIILIIGGGGLLAGLFLIGAVVKTLGRRSSARGAEIRPVLQNREDRTLGESEDGRGVMVRTSPSFCPYCGLALKGFHVNYCPQCGANLQT
ncbi:MAG: hypothetical protein WED05_12585 [Candidatus Atabeyarchaeum deiterrae]